MGRKITSAMAACVAVFGAPAWADYDPDAYPPYETCALCHGLFGVSHRAKFPHLGGQDPAYIQAQIQAFLSGRRSNDGGQMVAIVSELTPEEVPVVVEWFASQDPPNPVGQGDARGAQIFSEAGCADCHDDPTAQEGVPHLKSQHADYLVKQMRDFRDGGRGPGTWQVDHQPMIPPEPTAIKALAAYLSAEPRQ